MFKTILPFYIICFALYIFFSRQPDYLDGEFATGIIHYTKDSTQKTVAKVFFTIDKTNYNANASYPLRRLQERESVPVIYDTTNPSNAALYKLWGYWLRWNELLASVLIPFILYYAANAITSNPTPETLIEELENKNSAKPRKYN
jgi:hypothetical protein